MLRRPRFQPHLQVETIPGEGVFLISEVKQTVLQGRLYELVVPLLDGRSTAEVCERLRGQIPPAQVYYTLTQLEQKGYLTESEPPRAEDDAPVRCPPSETAWWTIQEIDPAAAARRLAEVAVAVRTVGDLDAEPFRALLRSLHVRLIDRDQHPKGPAQLEVVVTDGYLRDELEACNQEAARTGRPWLLVKPVGCQIWLGPLFRPGQTGCWVCLAKRLRANSPMVAYLEARNGQTGSTTVARCYSPATLQIGWGLAANAVVSWISRGELPLLEGRIQTLDLLTGEAQTHTLVRQPSCPACGDPAPAAFRPVVLNSCKKAYTEDGGHRALTPQQTLDRFGHHVSSLTGAVSVLERDHLSGDGVIHVYLSGHNVARQPRSWSLLRSDLRSSTSGKGTTDLQARASALCEGLERYSAVFRGDEPRCRARASDLGDAAIHPDRCLLFSDKQYRESNVWNARGNRFDEVPQPFDPGAELEWTPVWSLTRGAVCYLPTAFCYFNYPQDPDRIYCWSDSNGNAAGNTLEEAILQGFLELVERDSVALWWYNRVRRPGVDLDSFAEPWLGQLRSYLASHQRDLWVLDITSDLAIPAFAAMSRRTDGAAEQIMFGFGAHLDARVALLRAVTELNQMLSHVLGAPADAPIGGPLSDPETVHWLRTATVADQPYLTPLDGPARVAASYPAWDSDDLRDDVLACQALVERHGMEMLVLDQTRPEISLPVAKVIVPGLRHFWARFAPGRLYDVPVQVGWLPEKLTEEQLNPVLMFM
jgi:ribosomal protein S12 methylthiotransferase accessory factor